MISSLNNLPAHRHYPAIRMMRRDFLLHRQARPPPSSRGPARVNCRLTTIGISNNRISKNEDRVRSVNRAARLTEPRVLLLTFEMPALPRLHILPSPRTRPAPKEPAV